jgi:5-methylcytosine-specific restriction endonuclease McrA
MSEGYAPEELRRRVRAQAGDRCGYCLSPQSLVYGTLEVEHIFLSARGGSDDEPNLWLALLNR